MNNNLQIFNNEIFGSIRVGMIDDEIWFVAKDVVERLQYDLSANSYTKYVKRYVSEDEDIMNYNKETQVQYGLKLDYKELGQRGGLLISEYGLYDLVLAAPLPSAKEFKKWITHEVIPSIRKYGGYMVTNENDTDEEIMARALLIANKTIERKNEKIAMLENQIEELSPLAQKYNIFIDTEGLTDVETFSKNLGIKRLGRNNMYKYLRDKGYLMKNNRPYQKHIDSKYFAIKPCGNHIVNEEIIQDYKTYITTKGVNKIIDELIKDGYINKQII